MLLFLACLAPSWAHAQPSQQANQRVPPGTQIRICDDANEWPPFTEYERLNGKKTGAVVGRSVRLIQQIAMRYDWHLKIELLPWKRCLALVQAGHDFQMLLNAQSSAERDSAFLATRVVHEVHTDVLWSRRTHPQGLNLQRPEDLRRYRMGGNSGYSYPLLDRLQIPLSSEALHPGSLVQMMHLGRIDAVLVAREVMPTLRDLAGRPLRDDPELGQAPMPGARIALFRMMVTRKTPMGPALRADLDAELARLRASGELARIMGTD